MKPLPDLQCCVCLRICWRRANAERQRAWKRCSSKLETSHGFCPRCYRKEMAKVRGMEVVAHV